MTRTPGYLAEYATEGKRYRTRLWKLFDRVALALLAGTILNVVIMCPPQHGKSLYWSQFFPAWWLGKNPDHRVILGSHGAQYAAGWGRNTRDVIKQHGGKLFGLKLREGVAAANEWQLDGRFGGMVTAGIDGGIAGRSAELAIADDIVADANDGDSPVVKAKAWTWFEEEFSARLQRSGRRIVVMTRRAVDDPIGRILGLVEAGKENWTVIRLPAIAEESERLPEWGWSRDEGEALVQDLHPLEELRQTERARGQNAWAGLYQQRPYPRGGGDLKGEWFAIIDADPAAEKKVRAWDLAWSESPSAKRTAGILMTRRRVGEENKYHVADAVAGRWGSGRRNQIILQTAQRDGREVPIVFEQEGGSGGPAQIDELKRMLDGYAVHAVSASREGSKQIRADAMTAQAGIRNITMRKAPWNLEFIQEANSFPAGLIDMIDAAAHAYNYLAKVRGTIDIRGPVTTPGPGRLFGAGRLDA